MPSQRSSKACITSASKPNSPRVLQGILGFDSFNFASKLLGEASQKECDNCRTWVLVLKIQRRKGRRRLDFSEIAAVQGFSANQFKEQSRAACEYVVEKAIENVQHLHN